MRRQLAHVTVTACGLALCASVCLPSIATAQISNLSQLPVLATPQFPPSLAPSARQPVEPEVVREDVKRGEIDTRDVLLVPSFGGIFAATGRDFKSMTSFGNWSVLAGGLAVAGLMSPVDQRTSSGLSSAKWADSTFSAAEVTGAFPLHVAAGFAAYGLGRATGSATVAQVGADLVRAQLVSQGTAQAIKFAVGRTRPDGTDRSFPSGHSASMFATATVLQEHFGWKVGIPAYAAATYVAAGRIQTQRHFLSDVAFGAAIGIVSGRTVTIGRGKARFALAPAAMPGGVGVSATLVR